MFEINENALVVKSNPIIQGKFIDPFTPREMDLLTVLFTTIDKDAKDIGIVRIQISDLIKIFDLKGKSAYEHIAKITDQMLKKVITINDPQNKKWTKYVLLTRAKYDGNEGYTEFCFNHELKPFLLEVKQYAKYILRDFLPLKSFYSKRIYELIIQYKNTQNPSGEWQRKISVEDLKDYLGLNKGAYEKYNNLKNRVLVSSVEEINEKTNISISFEEKKQGRKVAFILFQAQEKPKQTVLPELPSETPQISESVAILTAHGVNLKTAENLARTHSEDAIRYAIKKLEQVKKTEQVGNPAGWLVSMLSTHALDQEQEEAQTRERKQQEERHREARKKELSDLVSKVQKEYREYFIKTIDAVLLPYSDELVKKKKEEFLQFLEAKQVPAFAINKAKKDYWLSMLVYKEALEFFQEVEGVSILTTELYAQKSGIEYRKIKQELESL